MPSSKKANSKTKQPKKRASTKTPAKTAKLKPIKKTTKKPTDKAIIKVNDDIQIELVVVELRKHKDKKGGHYHIKVDSVDENLVSVGLSTKSKKGKNHPNYHLDISPLNDGKTAFMRRQGTVAPKGEYEKPRKGTMTPKDFEQAKVIGEKAKQKYLNKKAQKKSND